MKRNRNSSRHRRQTIQVWTYDQAMGALPYVTSIMRTLRDYRLQAHSHKRTARRIDAKPGRPDRDALIAREEALAGARKAEERFQEALDELHTLDVYCLDAVRGLALIPFAHEDELAWYVFDLFEPSELKFWRLHRDSLETRRPIPDQPASEGPVVV